MKWSLKKNPEIPDELKSEPLNPITLRLLLQRGFFSKEQIEKFPDHFDYIVKNFYKFLSHKNLKIFDVYKDFLMSYSREIKLE